MQKAMTASEVVKDVLQSVSTYRKSIEKRVEWDAHPHDDEKDCDGLNHGLTNGDLVITPGFEEYHDVGQGPRDEKKGFEKASSILLKYGKLEESNPSSSQVQFSAPAQKPIKIPDHLRKSLPDPLGYLANQKNSEAKKDTSSDLADRATQLRESLEKLQAQRAAKLKALKAKTKCAAKPPPPPPPLCLSKKKSC